MTQINDEMVRHCEEIARTQMGLPDTPTETPVRAAFTRAVLEAYITELANSDVLAMRTASWPAIEDLPEDAG